MSEATSAGGSTAPEIGVEEMCDHRCQCPSADSADRDAALVVAEHHDQGWVLLCNGVVLFEDTGELLPDGKAIGPHARVFVPHDYALTPA